MAVGGVVPYALGVIDTHCHLTFDDFQEPVWPGGVAAVVAKAAEHGVDGVITICTTTRGALDVLAVAERFERVWCTAGVHPLYSDEGPHEWEIVERVIRHPKCVAWGELGLDNHYKEPSSDSQREVLAQHLEVIERVHASGVVKPIVLHCREAFDDLIPVLKGTKLDPSRCVFHCFTGTQGDMRKILDFGSMVSITGVATYKNTAEVRAAIRLVPIDRIMIETDAPFLSPDPHRGVRPCQPWMSSVTARAVAEIRGESWDVFHAAINENAQRFFGIPAVGWSGGAGGVRGGKQ